MDTETKAAAVVDAVLDEFSDRSGWDAFWDGIDEEICREIIATLRERVEAILDSPI